MESKSLNGFLKPKCTHSAALSMTGFVTVGTSESRQEIVTKVAWYYLHERIWALVRWGRRPTMP